MWQKERLSPPNPPWVPHSRRKRKKWTKMGDGGKKPREADVKKKRKKNKSRSGAESNEK